MHVLQGDKIPKRLMRWLKNCDGKINKKLVLESSEKWAMHKQIVDVGAQLIVLEVETNCELLPELIPRHHTNFYFSTESHVFYVQIIAFTREFTPSKSFFRT